MQKWMNEWISRRRRKRIFKWFYSSTFSCCCCFSASRNKSVKANSFVICKVWRCYIIIFCVILISPCSLHLSFSKSYFPKKKIWFEIVSSVFFFHYYWEVSSIIENVLEMPRRSQSASFAVKDFFCNIRNGWNAFNYYFDAAWCLKCFSIIRLL